MKHLGAKGGKKPQCQKKFNPSVGEFLVATSSYGCPTARPFQAFGLCVKTKKMFQKKKEEGSYSPRLT